MLPGAEQISVTFPLKPTGPAGNMVYQNILCAFQIRIDVW